MTAQDHESLIAFRDQVRLWAIELGFDMVGFAPAVTPPNYQYYLDWLQAGHQAGMAYMQRQAEARETPDAIFPFVATIIVVGLNYKPEVFGQSVSIEPHQGRVAAYAQGQDYHTIFWETLDKLLKKIQSERPEVTGRAIADSAPLMERDYAQLAGLGWVGKNTCLIHKKIGSFTLLGELLIDLPLPPDEPFTADHCGTCTRCLDACPTQAFEAPYQLNAQKCISYWTIEHKGEIPDEIGQNLNGWVFGCDICQEVCPWNRKSPVGKFEELKGDGRFQNPDLLKWLKMQPAELKKEIKGTALERTKHAGLIRNACHVLAANGVTEAIPELQGILGNQTDDGVRRAAENALKRLHAVDPSHGWFI